MYARISNDKTEFFQWDTGQYMEVSPDVDRIDFQFRNTRDMVYGVFSENGVIPVPDVLLQKSGILDVLIMSDSDGVYTVERMEIAVIERPIPPGYVMTSRGQIVTYDDFANVIGKFDLLQKSGGTMSGNISMDGWMVTDLDDAEADGDAVSKHFADTTYLSLDGGTMRGFIHGIQIPQAEQDAASKEFVEKYAQVQNLAADTVTTEDIKDNAVTQDKIKKGAVSVTYTATIGTEWTGTEAPFRQEIPVEGITAEDTPIIDAEPSAVYATGIEQEEEFGAIHRITTADGKLIVEAKYKTSVAIPIKIRCIRR